MNIKLGNYFYYPSNEPSEGLTTYVMIGDKKNDDSEYRGKEALYMRMVKSLGIMSSSNHTTGIDFDAFSTDSAILCYDTEVVPQAPHPGQNTYGSGGCTIHIRGMGTSSSDSPAQVHLTLLYDVLLDINDGGVTVAM